MSYYDENYRTHVDVETILLNETDGIEYQTRGASAAITPGELVEYDGADGAQAHSTDGGVAKPRFALEADRWGKTIDDDILADEEVTIAHGKPGTRFYAFLAAGENVAADDALVSAGNGALRAYDEAGGDTGGNIIGTAYEAVDNSGGADPVRIRVET